MNDFKPVSIENRKSFIRTPVPAWQVRDNPPELNWQPWGTNGTPALPAGVVHVWRIRLGQSRALADRFCGWLDEAERQKAGRFHFDRDAVSFVLTRAHLRMLLGSTLGLDPRTVRFEYGPAGKPLLPPADGLWFNVSHSGKFAVLAMARHRVGIDVERMRPIDLAVAKHYFSAAECRAILALPPGERQAAFFRCWSRKEAYLKARGDGIGFGLDRFEVTVDSQGAPGLVWVDGEPHEPGRWQFSDLSIHPEYCGAVALEHRMESLRCWEIEVV
jgi:4'-phosphopantetheinyl transferase